MSRINNLYVLCVIAVLLSVLSPIATYFGKQNRVGEPQDIEIIKPTSIYTGARTMQNNLAQLKTSAGNIETTIDKREDSFYEKPDEWQDSEDGQIFQSKTVKLSESLNRIKEAIETLEEFLS